MPEVFERKHLHDLVQIVGRALKEEDESLRDPLSTKAIYNGKGVAGLYRADIEHFYQYIAWKALVRSDFPFAVLPEHDKRDLWLCDSAGSGRRVAIGEMKRWVSVRGEKEMRSIRSDIKARQQDCCPGFILLTTVQDPNKRTENLKFLADRLADLGVTKVDFEDFYFRITECKGEETGELEFGLIGFMVNTGVEA